MLWRACLAVAAAGLLSGVALHSQTPAPARGPLSPIERQLVGTWRLLTWEDRPSADKPWTHMYGEHPFGLFIYTADGHVAIQVMRNGPPDPTIAPRPGLNDTFHAYCGTFTVDESKHIVVHHVEASESSSMVNTDQPREFELTGDRLILGDQKVRRRVLVRLKPL